MVIPLMSQFPEYETGDGEQRKQDCETKAFHQLAARIKKAFPRLPMMLLLDGLYPNEFRVAQDARLVILRVVAQLPSRQYSCVGTDRLLTYASQTP